MPYIKDYDKGDLELDPFGARNCGELNYVITKLIIAYMKKHGKNYQTCNDIVGALDNAKDEFKRRIQNPYENYKILENGDVYQDII